MKKDDIFTSIASNGAEVIANIAHKIEKVAQELSSLHKDSFINNERIELRRKHLVKYSNELKDLMQII